MSKETGSDLPEPYAYVAGHVLEGRFQAQVVDKESSLRAVCRYIVLNPVRGGLVTPSQAVALEQRWATAGEAPVPAFLTVDWMPSLGGTFELAVAARRCRQFVEAGLAEPGTALEYAGLAVGGVTGWPYVRDHLHGRHVG